MTETDGRTDRWAERATDRWDAVAALSDRSLLPPRCVPEPQRSSDTEPAAGAAQPHADAGEPSGDHGLRVLLLPGDLPGRGRQDPEGGTGSEVTGSGRTKHEGNDR